MATKTNKRAVITRRRGIPHRKWSSHETTHLLDYIRDNDFEKPTGRVYYQKFLHMNHLNIQWTLVRNKTRNLRTTYEKALKWLHSEDALNMPEGVTKQSKIAKMCPHFEILNEVFCERTNLQKLRSSPSNENSMLELEYPVDKFQSYSSEHGSLYDESRDIKIEDITVEEKLVTENVFATQNHDQPLRKRKASEAFDITVTNDTKHNSCECVKEVVRTMASLINDRNDYQQARLDLERSKFEFEKERITRELELREKELQQNERLKLLEIESKERIQMKELEYKYKAA